MAMIAMLLLLGALSLREIVGAQEISLSAIDWNFKYSTGLPRHPEPLGGGIGWWFEMPAYPDSVNYLMTPFHGDLLQYATLTITARMDIISGAPRFLCADPLCTDPGVHLYVQRSPLNLYNPYARWWAIPIAYDLTQAGVITFTVGINPALWLSVYGEHADASDAAMAGWVKTMSNPGAVGMTFGGEGNYGHGISVVGGTVTFSLIDYRLD